VDGQRAALYGDTLVATGRLDQAIKYLHLAVRMSPDRPEYVIKLSKALINHDESAQGVDLITSIMDQLPPSNLTGCVLATALDRLGRINEATTHIMRALQLLSEPTTTSQRVAAANAAFRMRRWDLVVENLESVVTANPGHPGDRLKYGMALASKSQAAQATKGDSDSAVTSINKAIEIAKKIDTPDQFITKLEARKTLYEQGKPCRQ
jgi:tetratricopeptide (TPR) repeat protein